MAELGRILIADDEETFLYSTAALLRREGYECACTLDAATAAKMLCSADYDLLIADIKMPGNPDLELIRDLPHLAEGLPVILVTGYPSLRSAIQSIQLPVVAYLVKPFDFSDLLAAVKGAIEQFRIYRAVRSIRQRLQNWSRSLENIEKEISLSPAGASGVPLSTFLNLTLCNIIGALLDLKHLTETLALHEDRQDACHLLQCPRPVVLVEALRETIAVLEKTKSAFKSKELGTLRQKLEDLVKNEMK